MFNPIKIKINIRVLQNKKKLPGKIRTVIIKLDYLKSILPIQESYKNHNPQDFLQIS